MNIIGFAIRLVFDINTYIGIIAGGVGAIAYFTWTKSQINWKKK